MSQNDARVVARDDVARPVFVPSSPGGSAYGARHAIRRHVPYHVGCHLARKVMRDAYELYANGGEIEGGQFAGRGRSAFGEGATPP